MAISEAVKSVLVQKGEVKEQKVKVIYNPAHVVGLENEVIKNESEFIFLMVCRLEAVKNISSVLISLSNIIHGTPYEPYLKVIGEGSEMEQLRLLVKKLEIENYVAFEGYQRELAHYLGKADVFVIPFRRFFSSLGGSHDGRFAQYCDAGWRNFGGDR